MRSRVDLGARRRRWSPSYIRSSAVHRRHTSWHTALALVGAVVIGTTVVAIVGAAPAGADPIGECSTTTGVIVAVDLARWGGDIERGCDATLTTGLDALHAAGFTTADDTRDGPAFVCRINDDPPPAEEACVSTPPASEYWSYWYANAGQDSWTYSPVGAATYHPQAGSVDAWTFGGTDIDGTTGQPNFAPSAVRATNSSGAGSGSSTTTTATSPPTPSTTTTTGASGPTSGAGHSAPPTTSARSQSPPPTTAARTKGPPGLTTTTTGSTPAPPTAGSPQPPTRHGSRPEATPKIIDVAPLATDRQSAGSPVPLIIGAVLIAALAAAAGLVAWRRRRMS